MEYSVWRSVQEDYIWLRSNHQKMMRQLTKDWFLLKMKGEAPLLNLTAWWTALTHWQAPGVMIRERKKSRGWEDVFGECAVKQWGLLADFAIP